MDMDTDTLITRAEVMRRIGLCKTSLYKMMAAGTFPQPVKVTATAVRWRYSEVSEWIASRPRAEGASSCA